MRIRLLILMIGFAFLATSGIALVGFIPMQRALGSTGIVAMIVGCGISWLASCAGSIPVAMAASRGTSIGNGNAILAATAVRFVVALILVVPAAFSGIVDRTAMVMCVGISYLVLLLLDTLISIRVLRMAGQRGN